MPSRTYSLFVSAMAARQPVACMYQGHPRVLCPIILGHTNGVEKALTWQFDGTGSHGPVHGQWKCLTLSDVRDAEMVDGPGWPAGSTARRKAASRLSIWTSIPTVPTLRDGACRTCAS